MEIKFRQATDADLSFLDAVYTTCMKKHVERIYPWKSELFSQNFEPSLTQVIIVNGVEVGMVRVSQENNELYLGDIAILPAFQNQGIGTAIIQGILDDAMARNLSVRLRVLKQNPAKRLYKRLGFVTLAETETHYIMRSSKN